MQRVISQVTRRYVSTVRSMPLGLAACQLPLGLWAPHAPRWVSTSTAVRAREPTKPSAEEESQANLPQSLAGSEPLCQTEPQPAPGAVPEDSEIDPLQDTSISLYQRFKKTFKQYGKVMVPVHLLTSSLWFGGFYYAAMKGVNVVPLMEYIGLPERMVNILRDSQSGYALTAYAMYKLATPARYTVTLGGTSLLVQYLRKHGHFSTPPPVKDYLHDKMEETRELFSEKMEETKERFSEKMEETKELLSEKMEETKDKFSEKLQETKDTFRKQRKTD